MQNVLRIALVCLLLSLGTPGQERFPRERFIGVSIIQLIATPERYNDKLVSTYGFLGIGWESSVLWLHKEDGENLLPPNGIWLEPSAEMRRNASETNLKYVAIIGVFHAFQSGRPGYNINENMSGGLTDIRRCTVWSDPAHPFAHKYDNLTEPKLKER